MRVYIAKGTWRGETVSNMEFDMVSPDFMSGKLGLYVTVCGKPLNANTKHVRIYLRDRADATVKGQVKTVGNDRHSTANVMNMPLDGHFNGESEAETIGRIDDRFDILTEMTGAAAKGVIRGLIVSGAPGTGKSFGVEAKLKDESYENEYEVIRGNVSPIGLYKKLYEFSEKGNVIVFDDSDSVFYDQVSLGLLKTALDTSAKRTISWNLESAVLKDEDIPRKFDFHGSVIFITNMDLESSNSKQLKPHLDALISRSHYLDLTIKTQRDKFLRIKGLVMNSSMLKSYNFAEQTKLDILDYMKDNMPHLRELSLRTTIKIADIVKMKPAGWRRLCDMTVCRSK